MNQTAFAAFIAFWTAVACLTAVYFLSAPQARAADDDLPEYSMEEVAEHNTEDDCWKVIRGKVYDFTDYIPKHPTPPMLFTVWCGKESTEAYDTKGYGRPHSDAADAMLDEYLIGRLADEDAAR